MLFTISITAFATDRPTNKINFYQESINEYEALKALAKESASVLDKEGFLSTEISKIQNYKQIYSDYITSLQALTFILQTMYTVN